MTDNNSEQHQFTRTCPACDVPVESFRQLGPVTWVLEPCGHQIDDRIHTDFWRGE